MTFDLGPFAVVLGALLGLLPLLVAGEVGIRWLSAVGEDREP